MRTDRSQLVFWSAFDLHGWRSDRASAEWIENRFRYWLAFSLRSILAQHEPEFRYWLLCDGSLRAGTEPLAACIRDERVRLVYSDQVREAVSSLPPAEHYLLARLDSDDLYAADVAGELLRQTPRTEFLQFNAGFGCDLTTGAVRKWRSRSSPFYCRVHGQELRDLTRWRVENHTRVRQRASVLGAGRFLVTIHGANTSSSLASGRGWALSAAAARSALASFGLGREHELAALLRVRRGSQPPPDPATLAGGGSPVLVSFACAAHAPRSILALGAGPAAAAAARHVAGHPGTTLALVDRSPDRLARVRALAGAGAGAVRTSAAPSPGGGRHDLVVFDAGADTPVEDALRHVLPSGLVLLTEDAPAPPERWLYDTYPEVERATRNGRDRGAQLLGRVIGPSA